MNNGSQVVSGSDVRIKTNIKPFKESALDKINNIYLKSYDFIANQKHVPIGIIAQQLQSVMPDAVEGEDFLAINQYTLIMYIIKAIQELSQKQEIKIHTINDYVDKFSIEEKKNFKPYKRNEEKDYG